MKELKPDKYRSLKQTIVLKNKIDTVAGSVMVNEVTNAQLAAESTDSVSYSVNDNYEFFTREYNQRQDNINKWHVFADSLVAVHMKTFTKHFSLQTPLAGNFSATVMLSGKEYKIASKGLSWNDVIEVADNPLSAQSKILDDAQVYTTDWTGSSNSVNFESGRVNLFAWFKEAKTVNWTSKYISPSDSYYTDHLVSSDSILTQWLGTKDLYAANDPDCTLDCSSTLNIYNRPSAWYIYNEETVNAKQIKTPIMFPNPYRALTHSGIWKNQPMFLIAGSDQKENGKPFSNEQETMVAQSIPIDERYKHIKVTVTKTDLLGYEFDVTVEYPSKYLYIAAARGCDSSWLIGALFNWTLIDSIGFVDIVNQLNIKLYGEVFDESTEEYSVQLDASGNPQAGSGKNIKRLSNNELLTKGATVTGALSGQITWSTIKQATITLSAAELNINTGDYQLIVYNVASGNELKDLKKKYELGMVTVTIDPITSTFNPGDIYETELYTILDSGWLIVKGISPSAHIGDQCIVTIKSYSESRYTGSWRDYAAKLLINLYRNGRAVINAEVDSSFIMDDGGVHINDWIKVKDIHNRWITRNNQVAYFEVKNIRKIYENDKYTYQITAIESGYGEQRVDYIELIDYSDYSQLVTGSNYLAFYNRRDSETGYFALYDMHFASHVTEEYVEDNERLYTFMGVGDVATPIEVKAYGHAEYEWTSDAPVNVSFLDYNWGDWYIEWYTEFDCEGEVTEGHLRRVVVNFEWPEDGVGYVERHTPFIYSGGYSGVFGYGDFAVSGRAITTSNDLGLDSGFVQIADYNELTDSILFVIRCPVWAVDGNPVNPAAQVTAELIEHAGFFDRNGGAWGNHLDINHQAIEFKTFMHYDGNIRALVDKNNEALYTSNNSVLVVEETEHLINYMGLYLVAWLKPSKDQMKNGIVPYIKNKEDSEVNLTSETYAQGQYYHLRGASFNSIEIIWKDLIDKEELNNYHGQIYPLPSIPDDD